LLEYPRAVDSKGSGRRQNLFRVGECGGSGGECIGRSNFAEFRRNVGGTTVNKEKRSAKLEKDTSERKLDGTGQNGVS